MSTWETIALGAIAGGTIFLGLPLGRLRSASFRVRTLLSGMSAGILLFLLLEIFHHATEPVEDALVDGHWGEFSGLSILYVVGLGVGLLSLEYFRRLAGRQPDDMSFGPGAMSATENAMPVDRQVLGLGMTIAVGIGLHNFAEGLAIGQAAAIGEITLAVLLVVGFALHNATEGFGIVGPLAGSGVRPSWSWLLLAGLVAGGPTVLGTIIGTAFTSQYVLVAFLALSAGAIVYVLGELFAAGRRLSWTLTLWGVFGGFLLGLATELVIELARG